MSHSGTLGAFGGAALILGLLLASCGPNPPVGVSGPAVPDAGRLCSRFDLAPGTEALASCIAKLDNLARQQVESQKLCEGIRQRALSMPAPSGGVGNVIATSDADYQSCMNGALAPPVQLALPTGRTLTCRLIQQQIACD